MLKYLQTVDIVEVLLRSTGAFFRVQAKVFDRSIRLGSDTGTGNP